jgi:hypothetical protein
MLNPRVIALALSIFLQNFLLASAQIPAQTPEAPPG